MSQSTILFMKHVRALLFFSTVIASLFIGSCSKEVVELPAVDTTQVSTPFVCDSDTLSFSVDILPIFRNNCALAGCHNTATSSAGVVLENHGQIEGKKDRVVARAITAGTMPPSGPLDQALLDKIQCWIDEGTPG